MLKSFLQSSVDPNKLSLTVQSLAKAIIFLVGYYAVSKGFDPTIATSQINQLTDVVINIIPAGFAVYHGIEAVWGITRKLIYSLGLSTGQTETPVVG